MPTGLRLPFCMQSRLIPLHGGLKTSFTCPASCPLFHGLPQWFLIVLSKACSIRVSFLCVNSSFWVSWERILRQGHWHFGACLFFYFFLNFLGFFVCLFSFFFLLEPDSGGWDWMERCSPCQDCLQGPGLWTRTVILLPVQRLWAEMHFAVHPKKSVSLFICFICLLCSLQIGYWA